MRGPAAFILLSTFNVIRTLKVPKQSYLTEAGVGDTVTLTCNISGHEKGLFYWYKMKYGHMAQTVVMGSFGAVHLEGEFKNSRLKVTQVGDVYSLTLTRVRKEDEAMYYCQAGTAYMMDFINSTHLTVNQKDFNKQPKPLFIVQSSDMKSDQMEDLVTLQCSVLPENKDDSAQCSGKRCVRQLFREILFGEETKLKTETRWDHVVIGLGVLLALCVIVIAVLIIYRD